VSRQELRELVEKASAVLRLPNGFCGTVTLIVPRLWYGAAGWEWIEKGYGNAARV